MCWIYGNRLRRGPEGCQGALIRLLAVKELIPDISRLKLKDKTRSGLEDRTVSPGENSKDGFFGPRTAPNSFKRSLDSLHDFMELIPPNSGVRCLWCQLNI